MSLIQCPECGHEVSEQAATCPQCGYPLRQTSDSPVGVSSDSSTAPSAPQSPRRAVGTIVAVLCVIVALAAAGGWYLFYQGDDVDTEESVLYENIVRYQNTQQLDSLSMALRSYFDTYEAEAPHYSELQSLRQRFFTEETDWQNAVQQPTCQSVRHFLDLHPDGFFLNKATAMFDSLSYQQACSVNTREAYDHYLSQFPQGTYIAQARRQLSSLDKAELTPGEEATATEVLTSHFDALASNDRTLLSATLADEINTYIGKANPEMEEIYAYMARVHASHRSLMFHVKNPQVTKLKVAGRNLFNIKFTLEESVPSTKPSATSSTESGMAADESEPAVEVKQFSGAAVLNEDMRITSLVLR